MNRLSHSQLVLKFLCLTILILPSSLTVMAQGKGPGAANRADMARIIIGGQALSLLLSLLVTPVAYSLFAEAGEKGFTASVRPLLARLRVSLSRSATS